MTSMKGVILAGGLGTRLQGVTGGGNKHLVEICGRAMVEYATEAVALAGVGEVMVVSGTHDVPAFEQRLGDGRRFGVERLAYGAQRESRGIVDALAVAERFVDGDACLVVLGDNLFGDGLRDAVRGFGADGEGARFGVIWRGETSGLGVARFAGEGPSQRLMDVEEKPIGGGPGWVVCGAYVYGADVFEMCRRVAPSARGELEVTDLNRMYIEEGRAGWWEVRGWWCDAGTTAGLEEAQRLVSEEGANGVRR